MCVCVWLSFADPWCYVSLAAVLWRLSFPPRPAFAHHIPPARPAVHRAPTPPASTSLISASALARGGPLALRAHSSTDAPDSSRSAAVDAVGRTMRARRTDRNTTMQGRCARPQRGNTVPRMRLLPQGAHHQWQLGQALAMTPSTNVGGKNGAFWGACPSGLGSGAPPAAASPRARSPPRRRGRAGAPRSAAPQPTFCTCPASQGVKACTGSPQPKSVRNTGGQNGVTEDVAHPGLLASRLACLGITFSAGSRVDPLS